MTYVSGQVRRFVQTTKAVSALEYGILVGVIAVATAATIAAFSDSLDTAINDTIGNKVVTGASSAETPDLTVTSPTPSPGP